MASEQVGVRWLFAKLAQLRDQLTGMQSRVFDHVQQQLLAGDRAVDSADVLGQFWFQDTLDSRQLDVSTRRPGWGDGSRKRRWSPISISGGSELAR